MAYSLDPFMMIPAIPLYLRTSIPNARIAVVEGPGHEIYVDEPDECINALLKFLQSLK